MTKKIIVVAIALLSTSSWAVNKCTGPGGKVTYQEAPCASSEAGQALKLPQAASTPGSTPGKQLPFKVLPLQTDQAKAEAATGMALAKQRLKDPGSAQFANVRVLSFDALGRTYTMTCGELNAKNSFGGYVGAKPFWVYDGVFTETFDHYLPTGNLQWLMGSVQKECLSSGTSAVL